MVGKKYRKDDSIDNNYITNIIVLVVALYTYVPGSLRKYFKYDFCLQKQPNIAKNKFFLKLLNVVVVN